MKISNNQSAREVYSLKENSRKLDTKQTNDKSANSTGKAGDSLTLSGEALKFAQIREKISNGFYDKPEVLDKLTQKLDKIIEQNIED
jgi:hypothetical protein